jgi:hypothetical protein
MVDHSVMSLTFQNGVMGFYHPGGYVVLHGREDRVTEHGTLLHEKTHELLTTSTTLGLAAVRCGMIDPTAPTPPSAMSYLRFYFICSRRIQEGAATASEAIHWPRIATAPSSELLKAKTTYYASAARELLELSLPVVEGFTFGDSLLDIWLRDVMTSAIAVAILNPAVSVEFYEATIAGEASSYQHALMQLPSRQRAILGLQRAPLVTAVRPLIEQTQTELREQMNDLDTTLQHLFPREGYACWRAVLLANKDDPGIHQQLQVSAVNFAQLRFRLAAAVARAASLSWGDVEAAPGPFLSLRDQDLGRVFARPEIIEPVKASSSTFSLERIEPFVLYDEEHITIPEVAGPFKDDGGGIPAIVAFHAFNNQYEHVHTFLAEPKPPDYHAARRLCEIALQKLQSAYAKEVGGCLGVVTAYGVETTPIAPVTENLRKVHVEPFGVGLSMIDREAIVGTHAGRALIVQQLTDNTPIWQGIPIGSYDIPERTLQGLDRCYLWVILNGVYARVRWSYYKEKDD